MLLLGPRTPMIFMGQEFNATTPFPYFADVRDSGAAELWNNRKRETADFEQYAGPAAQDCILDPLADGTAGRAILNISERNSRSETFRLFEDMLKLRHTDPVLSKRPLPLLDGAVLGERAFALRWFTTEESDRLLIINFGAQINRAAIAEPLLAAPRECHWELISSTDDPRYGGLGIVAPFSETGIYIAAECASFMIARH